MIALLLADLPGPGNIWFPIAFVLIMMVVAALVAAGGDRMGHRAARRKLRIGKLRPRHVSTLIAVVTGMLISLVTFGVVFAVWSDFRNALLQYDNLNAQITRLNSEIEETQVELRTIEAAHSEAQARIAEQSETLEAQGVELAEKTAAAMEARAQATQARTQLQRNQEQLRTAESRLAQRQRELAKVERDIVDAERRADTAEESERLRLTSLRTKALSDIAELNRQIEGLKGEIARAETGERVIAVGDELAYVRIPSGQAGRMEGLLEAKLIELKSGFEQRGLDFDPASREALLALLDQPLDDSREHLVVIRAAANVFTGDRVSLAFDVRPVTALVNAGDPVLDILISEHTARITGLRGITREVAVPARFDRQSMVNFAVDAQAVFSTGARAAGFMPDVRTGDYPSPVERLADVADELLERPRPLRIQFVAKRAAGPLDDVADAELYLSQPGAQRQQETRPEPPAPSAEDPPEPDVPSLPEETEEADNE